MLSWLPPSPRRLSLRGITTPNQPSATAIRPLKPPPLPSFRPPLLRGVLLPCRRGGGHEDALVSSDAEPVGYSPSSYRPGLDDMLTTLASLTGSLRLEHTTVHREVPR
jgi:hypothetical protein